MTTGRAEMTLEEAIAVMEIEPPPLGKCKLYTEAATLLDHWKSGPLKSRYRELMKECHPDLAGPGATEMELALRGKRSLHVISAYEHLIEHLEVRRREPSISPATGAPMRGGRQGWVRNGSAQSIVVQVVIDPDLMQEALGDTLRRRVRYGARAGFRRPAPKPDSTD